jgi:hypothetical protein
METMETMETMEKTEKMEIITKTSNKPFSTNSIKANV